MRTVCVHDATTGLGGCKQTPGVPATFVHPNHAACTGHSCAYLGGHRSIWPPSVVGSGGQAHGYVAALASHMFRKETETEYLLQRGALRTGPPLRR